MKSVLLPAVGALILLSGCSSAFKTAQTPDDVYYSYGVQPQRNIEREVADDNDVYRSYWESTDDQYLRMKVRDRDRWGTIDDVDYWYGYNNPNTMWNPSWNVGFNFWNKPWAFNNPWAFNSWNNPWAFNNHWGWNSWANNWNNPWCWNRPVGIIIKNPTGSVANVRPGMNRAGYGNSLFDRGTINTGTGKPGQYTYPAGYGNSGLFRSIFGSGGSGSSGTNNSSGGYSRPARFFDGGGSNSGSSSGGSSSGSSRSSGSSSGGSSSGGSRGGRGGN